MIYDFLVIGGGISGASAAYTLSEHGSVLLLESESSTGYHATGRSAALFTRHYGGEIVRQINAASAEFFQALPVGFCETPLLSPRGFLAVAPPGHEAELDTSLLEEEICEIDPRDACEMAPFLRPERVSRAIYEAGVSDIDVATLLLSFLKGARALGAMIITNQPVVALSRRADVWNVKTPNDSFSAAKIVNASGAWADDIGRLAGANAIGLVPKKRTAIIVKAPERLDSSSIPAIEFAGSDAYLKPDAGRLMASPGDATPTEPHDVWPDDMDIAVLADRIECETKLKISKIEHSWAGLRSFVSDEAPVVGFDTRVPDFFWLAGQGGFGIMMAPTLAMLTAELCTGLSGQYTDRFAQVLSPQRLQ